jgi:LEA14-like dessication related protein
MWRVLRYSALTPICLLSLACANLNVQRPTVSMRSASVKEITPAGFTLNFDVDLENPNSVALPLADVDYGLSLTGAKLVEGQARPEGSLPAKGKRPVTLPVMVTFDNLLKVVEGVGASGGEIPYGLEASFAFETGGGLLPQKIRVPLKYEGTLHARELLKDPMVLLRSSAARKLAERLIGSMSR